MHREEREKDRERESGDCIRVYTRFWLVMGLGEKSCRVRSNVGLRTFKDFAMAVFVSVCVWRASIDAGNGDH